MKSTQPEIELVRRAAGGDANAFGMLYESHLDAIYRYIFYRVSTHQDAEDLTEIVFLKAWQAVAGYQMDGIPFRAWLYRIAHNTVVDHYRTRKETEPLEKHLAISDEQMLLEKQVLVREEAQQLARIVGQLAPLHQHVLILRFVQGLSHAEVAEVLGKGEGAVRVLQYRALKELQALLMIEETKNV